MKKSCQLKRRSYMIVDNISSGGFTDFRLLSPLFPVSLMNFSLLQEVVTYSTGSRIQKWLGGLQ